MRHYFSALFVGVVTFSTASGCSAGPGDGGGADTVEDKVLSDGGPSGPTDVIWPEDVKVLVADNRGGTYDPPQIEDSTCRIFSAKYTLDVATRRLDWVECKFTAWTTPMRDVSGSRTITSAELASVDAAMKGVTISPRETCLTRDETFQFLEVTSASQGTKTYVVDTYYCCGWPTIVLDDGVKMVVTPFTESVFNTLRDLAHA